MFIAVGIVGAVLLVVFLVFDDFLDEIIPDADWISGPVIGSFLAAFGLFGWMVDSSSDAPTWLSSIVGVGGGLALGFGTYRLTKALVNVPTDDTPTPAALVGRAGRVITPIEPGKVGEVLVNIGGQPVKLTASADAELARGSSVVVVDVSSPTKVIVQSAEQFWGPTPP